MQLVASWPERDLLEHLAVGGDDRQALGDRRAHEQPSVGGERHAVRHVAVAQLAEDRRPAVLEAAHGVRHRLGPVHPALRVEGDAVRVDVRPLEQHLAVARRVEDVQAPGRAGVVAVVLLGARVGEPQAAVGAERKVVRTGQLVAGDARRELLDRAVRADTLDARHGAEVAAARDVAALRQVDGAVGAEDGAPGRAAGVREGAHRAVAPAQQLAGVAVTQDNGAVGHHHGAFRKTQPLGEQRTYHGSVLSSPCGQRSGMTTYRIRSRHM